MRFLPRRPEPAEALPPRGRRIKKSTLVLLVGLASIICLGFVYASYLSVSGMSKEKTVKEEQVKAKTDSRLDFLKPPLSFANDVTPDVNTGPKNLGAPPAADKQMTIKQAAYRKYVGQTWEDYYSAKLAMRKKERDSHQAGRDSLWESKGNEQQQAPVQHASSGPEVIGAENLPGAANGSLWPQADDKQAYNDRGGNYDPVQRSLRHALTSPYQIMAGNMIHLSTVGGATSAGVAPLVARVVSPVKCDTPAGLASGKPCIPAGSTIIINYNTRVSQGECRLQATADRLIFYPDKTSMDLGHQPIGDASGMAGLTGECDTHIWARLLNAVLQTGVQTATTLGGAALGAGVVGLGPISGVANQEFRTNIPPTIEVAQNVPITMITKKDLVFTGTYEPQELTDDE